MASRTAYHISADSNGIGDFDEADLYPVLESLNADYAECLAGSANTAAVLDLKRRLSAAGFPLQDFETKGPCAFVIKAMDEHALQAAKIRFLDDGFQGLKHMVGHMTPMEFTEKAAVSRLRTLIDAPFGDVVWLDMGTGPKAYSLPDAVRGLVHGTCYYVDAHTVALR